MHDAHSRLCRLCSLALLVMACGVFGCGRQRAEVAPALVVAAAADLKFAMDDMIEAFHARHPPWRVTVIYGSSGQFYAQLVQHAPFDMYFSADLMYPRKLVEAGLADESALFHYAVGRIVLWTLKETGMDVETRREQAMFHPSVRKVAIANPRHAPYGVAAEAALRSLGVYERIQEKLVFGENIAQTAQFIESGAAQIGVIALSLALAPPMEDKGAFWEIPTDAFPRMDQGGVILPWARNPEAARAFRDHVMGEDGRAILKAYGFFMPEHAL